MNINEALMVMAKLKVVYGYLYKDYTQKMIQLTAESWAESFPENSFEDILNATKEYIKTDSTGYPPTPGKINAILKKINIDMSGFEAWEKVEKEMAHTYFPNECKESFNNLPDICKKIVGTPRNLRNLSLLSYEKLAFAKKDFLEQYKYYSENCKTIKDISYLQKSSQINSLDSNTTISLPENIN